MEKSRKLSNEKFIEMLELEYLSHKLRALMYEKSYLKKMHNDIAEKKKEKILNLSAKFKLLNIFESDSSFEVFWKRDFLNEFGLPNFQYNPEKKRVVEYWDKFYSFHPKNKVLYDNREYMIKKNKIDIDSVILSVKNQTVIVPYNQIKIILFHNLSIDALR